MTVSKILVADDSSTLRVQIHRTLSEAGYCVVSAADGNEAVALLERERPSLAILDIEMPGLDGFAVCQHLQQMGTPWNTVPVLFLTSSRSHALEMLGNQLGAYLQKPVSSRELLRTVQQCLSTESTTCDEFVGSGCGSASQ